MDNEAKENAARDLPVGAESGQPITKTDTTIQQQSRKINPQNLEIAENLPAEITGSGRFCCWRYEERGGRKTKVPYDPRTGAMAKSNDQSSFADFCEAAEAEGYDGIGIGIFDGICAIDLDDCVTDSGFYSETAADIVALMHSYTEYSPSGDGLHILFRADGFRYDTESYYIMSRDAGIEVYVSGATSKYMTVTGKRCEEYEFGDRTEELNTLLDRYMRRAAKRAENAINANNSVPAGREEPALSGDDILQLAGSGKTGDAFRKLYSGSLEGYPSHSEADFALCRHLAFWTGRDPLQMDALFRKSGLMRSKWDRKQSGTTYGALTIQKAIKCCREVYAPCREQPDFPPIVPLTPQWSELPAFPVDALPEVVREYVEAVAENSQTSPDMAAVIGLGVLAVCLQGKYRVEGRPGYSEPLSLYTVVIASPGERKSSVMRSMTKDLYEYERTFNASRQSEIRENQQEREELDRRITAIKKKLEIKDDYEMKMELRQLEAELDTMPELEPVRFFADDCSSEALTSLIANNGGILSVISTEGGIFDIMAGRYSNRTNIDVWLKGHCGDAIYVDRMSRKPECIPHPALSAILSIQPSVLNEIMENTTMTGRGLIARFLYSFPPSRIGSRTFRTPPIPPAVRESYKALLFRLMALPVREEVPSLRLSEDAENLLAAYFEEHEKYLAGEGQAISDWAGKYIGAVLRIAGLLHGAEMEPDDPLITASTMRRAIRIGEYFLAHSAYAYSMMSTDLNIRKARFVLAKLKKAEGGDIKRSELFQRCRGKFFQKTEELFGTLELLEDHGYILQKIPESTGAGRPPDVHVLLNPAA